MGRPLAGGGEGRAFDVVRVGPPAGGAGQLEAAAARLVAVSSTEKGAGKRFLDAAKENRIDLTHLLASVNPVRGSVREVCLAVPGTGATAMFFTSNPGGEEARSELAAVVEAACAGIRGGGVKLAQALLEVGEHGSAAALEMAGFKRLDEMIYLRRPRPAVGEFVADAAGLGEGLSVSTWGEGDDADVKAALEKSYEGTLDCPELCGLRSTDDVLSSHRQTGKWDPSCWWVIRNGAEAVGVMLFNPCPDQSSVELVYFGLGVRLRGRGLGERLLRIGLAGLERRRETTVTCAVDARNTPARRLYERLGFTEFGRRVALVRALGAQ